ncbi:MAG: VWA domain-containing protein, partial [Epsilonproteobacteria bacterium]|nr:VWA domain-containing protein [Campylobacterota bacterium]
MMFLHPDYLFLMLVPLVFLLFLIFTNKSQIDRFYSKEIVSKLKISDGGIGQKGRNIFLFTALVLMVVAFARPVIPKGEVTVKSSMVDILIGIDVSKSMLANDVYPNRLDFAKKRVIEFMNSFKKARFGVVAFSSVGFLVSPISEDTKTVEYLVNNLSTNSLNQKGTDLFTPLELAKKFLKNEKEKILVLFTDGGDSKDFSKEIEFAKENDIKVYVYAVGTKKGSTIKDSNGLLTDKNGNIVVVKLNEAIKELAVKSGGAYIVGDYSGKSIKKLEQSIKEKIKQANELEKKIKTYKELFYYPLWGALLLLLFGFSSMPSKRVKSVATILLVMFAFSPLSLKAQMFDFQKIKQAKEYYKNKEYDKAANIYKELLKDKKDTQELKYDLANALYKEHKYKEALNYYQAVKSDNPELEFKKYFNEGNSLVYLQKYDEAIKAYKKALKIKDDEDARHNLKIVENLKKKKQNKKQNNKQNQKKNNKQNKNNKKQNKNSKQNKKS